MIDENQIIKIKWCGQHKQHYLDKGYELPNFREELSVKLNDVHDSYNGDVVVICDNCGREYTIRRKRYYEALKKYGNVVCCYCSKTRSLDNRQDSHYEKCIQFCKDNGYSPITTKDKIKSVESEFQYICSEHGLQTVKVKTLLAGKRCYHCSRHIASEKRWSHDTEERLDSLYGKVLDACNKKNYTLISEKEDLCDGWDSYVIYNCPIHGEHSMSIKNLVANNRGCPQCAMEKKKKVVPIYDKKESTHGRLTQDEIIQRVVECGGEIFNPEEYVNSSTKNLRISCPRCGDEFTTSLTLFTQHGGQLCSNCYKKESVGELKIRHFLETNEIEFDPQHWFPDCRDIKPLPFDFYLFNRNTIVEFDGRQHFEDNHFFNYSLAKNKKHDEIKTQYCIDNGIYLIRIPYWKLGKIDKILTKELLTNDSHEDMI